MAGIDWDTDPKRMKTEKACLHSLAKRASGSGAQLLKADLGCAGKCKSLRATSSVRIEVSPGSCDDPAVAFPVTRIEIREFYLAYVGGDENEGRGVHAAAIDCFNAAGAKIATGSMKGIVNYAFASATTNQRCVRKGVLEGRLVAHESLLHTPSPVSLPGGEVQAIYQFGYALGGTPIAPTLTLSKGQIEGVYIVPCTTSHHPG